MRNINNIFETRPLTALDPFSKEPIAHFKTLSIARSYLKITSNRVISDSINSSKVIFSKTLNKGIILKDYIGIWQNKGTTIFLKAAEPKK